MNSFSVKAFIKNFFKTSPPRPKDLRELFEPGVTERMWDGLRSLNHLSTFEPVMYSILDLVGIKVRGDEEETALRILCLIAAVSGDVAEFERRMIDGDTGGLKEFDSREKKILAKMMGRRGGFLSKTKPISHVRLSFGKNFRT